MSDSSQMQGRALTDISDPSTHFTRISNEETPDESHPKD